MEEGVQQVSAPCGKDRRGEGKDGEGIEVTIDKILEVEQLGVTSNMGPMKGAFSQLAAEVRRLRERDRVLMEALGYVVCCDVNPKTSDISPTSRLMFAANRARAAIEAVKE
jgi:hypothetical protein